MNVFEIMECIASPYDFAEFDTLYKSKQKRNKTILALYGHTNPFDAKIALQFIHHSMTRDFVWVGVMYQLYYHMMPPIIKDYFISTQPDGGGVNSISFIDILVIWVEGQLPWKSSVSSGFYHIAERESADIILGWFDHQEKRFRGKLIVHGSPEFNKSTILDYWKSVVAEYGADRIAFNPESLGDLKFSEETKSQL